MVKISIESEIREVEETLQELGLSIPNINKKILKKIVAKGKNKLRKAYRSSGLDTKTGSLYRSIYGSAKTDSAGYIGIVSKMAYRFIPQNYGATIQPKHGEYLNFKVGDTWVKVRSVSIPAHNFFYAAEQYVNSEEMQNDIISVLDKELDRLTKL